MNEELFKKYGLRTKDFFGKTKIYSKNDIWIYEIVDKKIILYHYNKFYNRRVPLDYHYQTTLDTMDHMCRYICHHDNKYKYPSWKESKFEKMFSLAGC